MRTFLCAVILSFATSSAFAGGPASAGNPPPDVEAWFAQQYGQQMKPREGVPSAGFKLLPKGQTNPCPPGWEAKLVAVGEKGAAPRHGTFGTVNCRDPNGFVPKVGITLKTN